MREKLRMGITKCYAGAPMSAVTHSIVSGTDDAAVLQSMLSFHQIVKGDMHGGPLPGYLSGKEKPNLSL